MPRGADVGVLPAIAVRLEHRCFAFADIEPVLAERIHDVRLVRHDHMLLPAGGCTPTSLRKACVRRSFSIGGTTRPPSVISGDATTSPKPSSVPVSTARWNMLV